jgi:hypothetical protein
MEDTPAGRLAIVARSLVMSMTDPVSYTPAYDDFREAFEIHIERELLLVRLDEAKRSSTFQRALEIQRALDDVNKRIRETPKWKWETGDRRGPR